MSQSQAAFTPLQVRTIIREAAQPGITAKSVIQKYGISDVQFYHWKQAVADLIAPEDEPVALRQVIARQAISFFSTSSTGGL